jgi:Domain of unknown function (DUF4280)
MSRVVVQGATLACSMGSSTSQLSILATNGTYGDSKSVASVQDTEPEVNLAPFGLCRSPTNPQVVAATSAAGGTLTPQPCVPAASSPWTPGSKSVGMANGGRALLNDACKVTVRLRTPVPRGGDLGRSSCETRA